MHTNVTVNDSSLVWCADQRDMTATARMMVHLNKTKKTIERIQQNDPSERL